ncbi:nose resistant to fluoxetine protein 6-like [Uranotaenia lowii]|uniref:nose resistant to fluoxetine protein 6-like n=1 Tax=Uranotaenia lowii TaxID=190385 RepID=UPI00247A343F|nr:nose resistant to fluoxetine protein 6-like [Uranotaenia lowii]
MPSHTNGLVGLIVILAQLIQGSASGDFIDLNEYLKFPKLYDYDHFGDCRRTNQNQFVYCLVQVHFKPNESSALWRNISKFSEDQRHYDHRIQERGICVPTCEKKLNQDLSLQKHHSHADLLKLCIGQELERDFGLQIEPNLDLQRCFSANDVAPSLDFLEVTFIIVSAVLLALTICSTWIDLGIRADTGFPQNYFRKPHCTRRHKLLTAFSLPRNVQRLKEPANTVVRQDLLFLEAFRFIQMNRVIDLHVTLAVVKIPKLNPEAIEEIFYNPWIVHYVAEFQHYVQTFFSISGMLLMINFLEHVRKNPQFDAGYLWKRLRARLYRIIPAYWFMLLLEASIVRRFSKDPLGEQFVMDSYQKCRRLWWTNLFFLNNYFGTHEPCMIQAWYLAADLQLFVMALLILAFIWRWPLLQKYIFTAAILGGVCYTTVIAYIRNYPPVMIDDLKLAKEYNFGNPYFELYQPFHLNIAIFVAGMLAGSIYHRFRESRATILRSPLMMVIFYSALVIYFAGCFSDFWIVEHRATIPTILLAIYATLYKHSWGLLSTVIQLWTSLASRKATFKAFFSHPFFAVCGKLCYSFYLVHFTIILQTAGSEGHPWFFTVGKTIDMMWNVSFRTLIYGFLLCVCIELPSGVLLKEYFESDKTGT